jgi:hypothetical protein
MGHWNGCLSDRNNAQRTSFGELVPISSDVQCSSIEADCLPQAWADLQGRKRFEERRADQFARFAECHGCFHLVDSTCYLPQRHKEDEGKRETRQKKSRSLAVLGMRSAG